MFFTPPEGVTKLLVCSLRKIGNIGKLSERLPRRGLEDSAQEPVGFEAEPKGSALI